MQNTPEFSVPVLFIIFNRPGATRVVFDEIRKVRPRKLFVVADGPREGKVGEKEKCEEARKITEQIDWECEVHRKYSDVNLGCAKGVPSGISWFFDNVEEGIILEDDCMPHPDFFPYCAAMLERYRDNEEVALVGGNNFQGGKKWGAGSYYFSAFPHLWGYAIWKRTWDIYDFALDSVKQEDVKNALEYYFHYEPQRNYWEKYFKRVKGDKAITTWDPQLLFSIWNKRGLSIIPNVNLVSNIGFGDDATHTQDIDSNCASILTSPILPVTHSEKVELCRDADIRFHILCGPMPMPKKIIRKISRILNS